MYSAIVTLVETLDLNKSDGSGGLLSALMPHMKKIQEDFQNHSKLVAAVI